MNVLLFRCVCVCVCVCVRVVDISLGMMAILFTRNVLLNDLNVFVCLFVCFFFFPAHHGGRCSYCVYEGNLCKCMQMTA